MKTNVSTKTTTTLAGIALAMTIVTMMAVFGGCDHHSSSDDDSIFTSRSYKGHASDADTNNLVRVYPSIVGTRLDNCKTCHTGGDVGELDGNTIDGYETKNACDWCHFIEFPPEPEDGLTLYPHEFVDTLNPFGIAYNNNGASQGAIEAIADLDSDGDGYTNEVEILADRFPGNPASKPGQDVCPIITLTIDDLKGMTVQEQFGLANANKQQFDVYSTYKGVKIRDLLDHYGVLAGATGIEVLSPDGYAKSFDMSEITDQYPDHCFYSGFGAVDLGDVCGFVEYPEGDQGYADGDTIAEDQWHIIAYERGDALDLEEAYLDETSGKINGEGPLRNIRPPGGDTDEKNTPDRGKNSGDPTCPLQEWNYNYDKDHNAGDNVKATVAIKVLPLPTGCEEFDIFDGTGWNLVQDGELVIFGHSVSDN